MDAKLAAYGAKTIVKMVCDDPRTSPELKRVLEELMGSDMKTLKHRRMHATQAIVEIGGSDVLGGNVECDVLSLVDGNGRSRMLVFF